MAGGIRTGWLKIGLNNPFLAGPLKASSSCVGIQR